ncbi:hypothetical protein F4802DRAFT_48814 [Xylaria palmicola]|nr:hypothetical protein F4802DRAFT_48814 [Xylaria palmicola]
MRPNFCIILAGAVWLSMPGARGQRIRLNEPATDTIRADDDSTIADDISLPDEMMVDEDGVPDNTEGLAVNRTDTNPSNSPSEEPVAISAVLLDGPPGPKDCRGNAVLRLGLSKPGRQHATPTCHNVRGVAQCGVFVANKDDGCEARVFAEPDCKTFANLAVFVPEPRAFGGYMRSIEVRCGVVGQTPPPLQLPGLKLPPGAVQAVG